MKKQTIGELIEELVELDRQVAAMDEHDGKSVLNDSMTDAELEVHRKSRNGMLRKANRLRKLVEKRKKVRTP